jgi:hypothetical protein
VRLRPFALLVLTSVTASCTSPEEQCTRLIHALCARAESEGCLEDGVACEVDLQNGIEFRRGCSAATRIEGDVDACLRAIETMTCTEFVETTYPSPDCDGVVIRSR